MNDDGPAFPKGATHKIYPGDTAEALQESKGMSLRDYACINLKISETDKNWLNELIQKALRDRFAGMALQSGLCPVNTYMWGDIAEWCGHMADAMIKEREK